MLDAIVRWSLTARGASMAFLGALLIAGVVAALGLPIDAVPDVSTVQVSVLTEAAGLSPEEIEQTVTSPIERQLNGVPGLAELRSISRTGLSAVTVVFQEDTNVWFARQLVLERLREVERDLPSVASAPSLAPVSTGLGEIYQFVVRSDTHSPMQLRTILDWEIVPQLRGVAGVVEVNTMGGELKQYQVIANAGRMHSLGLTLGGVAEAITKANRSVGGGYLERGPEAYVLRGVGLLKSEDEIGNVVVRGDTKGATILVKHVAQVRIGAALPNGIVTRDGEREAVTGVVMMLLGMNSRQVVAAVKEKMAQIRATLPAGVHVDVVYDRSDFIGRTLKTVLSNLLEGLLVVALVLALFLGSLRAALAVIVGIAASMSVALIGMRVFNVTGDLMSLGAIDFGFLVDGPIVIVEAMLAATAGQVLSRDQRLAAHVASVKRVMPPVAYSVAIIMLVYVPLLALQGVEGKMFRPMAITMACALLGALLFSLAIFPGLAALALPATNGHGPRWLGRIGDVYDRWIIAVLPHRRIVLAAAVVLFAVSIVLLSLLGADFVPRIFEGDAVVTIRRAPSISLTQARALDLQSERVLHTLPEVVTTLGQTGRAELAVDPVGNDNTDILTHLRPLAQWTTATDFDALSEIIKNRIEAEVPGTFVSVSQPIEDRTNELISGSRADVQIQLFGPELAELKRTSERIGDIARGVRGAGDVRVERLLGLPMLTVRAERSKLAKHGVRLEDAWQVLESARVGIPLGSVFEAQKRFDLRLLSPPRAATTDALGDFFVPTIAGELVPLAEVTDISDSEGPTQVRRQALSRTVRVEVNLRGRDLVSWVDEARSAVASAVKLPVGYHVTWGGQFENFSRAKARLASVVPLALTIIFLVLLLVFRRFRFALAVFSIVPLALAGGIAGLASRAMPFSIPAAVGFIALAGVSVLTGVVFAAEAKHRLEQGVAIDDALRQAGRHTLRAVLTAAGVAATGFLPMALATGAGAEVQRPLATVVISGIAGATALTLFVLPCVLRVLIGDVAPSATEATPGSGVPVDRHRG